MSVSHHNLQPDDLGLFKGIWPNARGLPLASLKYSAVRLVLYNFTHDVITAILIPIVFVSTSPAGCTVLRSIALIWLSLTGFPVSGQAEGGIAAGLLGRNEYDVRLRPINSLPVGGSAPRGRWFLC